MRRNIRLMKSKFSFFNSLLIVLCSLLIASCPDSFDSLPDNLPAALPSGMGSFSLALSLPRTVLPTAPALTDFSKLELVFTAAGGGAVTTEKTIDPYDGSLSLPAIFLQPGTYSLTVNAYRGAALAARGTTLSPVVIELGVNTDGAVVLKSLLAEGTGTFSWDVTVPAVDTASMKILSLADGGEVYSTSSMSGSRTLNSGPYNVIFYFVKTTSGQSLVWYEIVHIYSTLDSKFTKEFTEAYFDNTSYTVTFDSSGGSSAGTQSVLRGDKVQRPVDPVKLPDDPEKASHVFVNWYEDPAYTSAYDFDTPVTADITLYARWDKPENLSDAERWYTWAYPGDTDPPTPPTKATITHSVVSKECTITVGGIAEPNETNNFGRWKATANYLYTAKADAYYEYKFEAWTDGPARYLNIAYYNDYDGDGTILEFYDFEINSVQTPYTITGGAIPKDRISSLEFRCADQIGTFHVKIISINEITDPVEIFYAKVAAYGFAESDATITVSDNLLLPRIVTVPGNYNGKTLTITSASGTPYTLKRGAGDTAAANGLFTVSSGAKLVFQNIVIDGNHKNTNGDENTDFAGNNASLVRVNDGGEFTLGNGAVLKNNRATNGGAVYVNGSNAMFIINGTAGISGNTASTSGGGVYVNNGGTFTMKGGEVSGNKATTSGGGVYVSDGIFTVGGNAVVSGNTVTAGATLNNVYLPNGKYITIGTDGNAPAANMSIFVRTATASGVIVDSGAIAGQEVYFTADDDTKKAAYQDTGQLVLVDKPGTFSIITLAIEAIANNDLAMTNITAPIPLSKASNDTQTITITGGPYTGIEWKVAGVGAYAGQYITESGDSFELDANAEKYGTVGGHTLMLTVYIGGNPYMVNIRFTIVE